MAARQLFHPPRPLTKTFVIVGMLALGIARAAVADGIYWQDSQNGVFTIGHANLDGTGINRAFISGAGGGGNLAVDETRIYWTSNACPSCNPPTFFGTIGRANLDGTGADNNFISGIPFEMTGLAVDGSHIYWTTFDPSAAVPPAFAEGGIGRANLDGSGVNQSLISGLGTANGIAVDGAYIYWGNWNNIGQIGIGRANLDGSDVNPGYIPLPVQEVLHLAIYGNYIYWIGFGGGETIGRANLDGTGVDQNFLQPNGLGDGLAVAGNYIYWDNGNSIGRANLDGTGIVTSFVFPLETPSGLAVSVPVGVTITWVPVGNPFNPPDNTSNCTAANCGSVAYNYRISKYDITNVQYAEFLNAKAASDPNSLYEANMRSDPTYGGITQSGSSGSYTYAVKTGFENMPVTYVSFWSALRFANWLNNGQGTADTETGAYTITADGIAANSITRNSGATVFLPSENEWYKAAYYNPATSSYFAYPAGSNTPIVCAAPGATPNTANCGAAAGNQLTDVGAYTSSASPYGTFDQGGDVYQWNEQIMGSYRSIRGGFWGIGAQGLSASFPAQSFNPVALGNTVGFRVATVAADPPGCGMGGEVAFAMPLLMWLRSRRRRSEVCA